MSVLDMIGLKAKGLDKNMAQDCKIQSTRKEECPDKRNYESRKYMAEIIAKRRKNHATIRQQQTKHY